MSKQELEDKSYLIFVFLHFVFTEITDDYIRISIYDGRTEGKNYMDCYYMDDNYICKYRTLDVDAYDLALKVLEHNTDYMLGELSKYA